MAPLDPKACPAQLALPAPKVWLAAWAPAVHVVRSAALECQVIPPYLD